MGLCMDCIMSPSLDSANITVDLDDESRCIKFVEINLAELRSEPSLRRGLLCFLMMLWDCALVESATIDACIGLYDGTSVPAAVQQAQLPGGVGGEGASGSGAGSGGGAGAPQQPQAVAT
jgi:hypothetical protein